jgi:hypothetical protein
MALVNWVLAGAKAPEAVNVSIAPSDALPDMTVVTSAYLDVVTPSGELVQWAVAIASQTVQLLVLRHVFDAAGAEVARPGSYSITPKIATPGGERRAVPVSLSVRAIRG